MTVTKLELGCGRKKRPGFFGIDVQPAPEVDLVLDFEQQRLPFPDGSIEHI
jgi:predicted SAM-dependent methyltransferase